MASISLRVVRPNDLLILKFEFENFTLDSTASTPPRLIRERSTEPVFAVVHFPPQHISEAITEDFQQELDRENWVFISSESRLAFRLPLGIDSLPLTIEKLLDWTLWEPLPVFEPSGDGVRTVIKPQSLQTAIEIPFRLVFSPEKELTWRHRKKSFPINANAVEVHELWHTRMQKATTTAASGIAFMHVAWSPDIDFKVPHLENRQDDARLPIWPLAATNRKEIVQLSSDGMLLDQSQFGILDEEQERRRELYSRSVASSVNVSQLMLSSLGGWLNVSSQFDFPTLDMDLVSKFDGHEFDTTGDLFSLAEWHHVVSMGRDQIVRTVEQGYLFPFGHRANLFTSTKRQFLPSQAIVQDRLVRLVTQETLVVTESERLFARPGFPFTRVRIVNTNIPGLKIDGFKVVKERGGDPYVFSVVAEDHAGREVPLDVPMFWMSVTDANNPSTAEIIQKAYEEDRNFSNFNVQGKCIAYAPPTGGAQESTLYQTQSIQLKVSSFPTASNIPPFLPTLSYAEIHLDAVNRITGQAKTAIMMYHREYAKHGFEGVKRGVFATIQQAVENAAPLTVSLPTRQGGGIVAPVLALSGLSTELGAVTNAINLAQGLSENLPSPIALITEGKEKLLGLLTLDEIIDSAINAEQLPHFETMSEPGVIARFKWNPRIKKSNENLPLSLILHPLRSGEKKKSTLELTSEVRAQSPQSKTWGKLSTFNLRVKHFVTVEFDELAFTFESGNSPSLRPKIHSLVLEDEWDFFAKLSKAINDSIGTKSGPNVVVSASSIRAGFSFAVPDISLGTWGSIQNLALSAAIELFFLKGRPKLHFSFSRREKPFLLASTLVGGGGHFALSFDDNVTDNAVSSDRVTVDQITVEASLEFGGVVSLDLGIAKGDVQIVAGIFTRVDVGTDGRLKPTVTGQARQYACLEVFRILALAVEFYVSLSYNLSLKKLTGRAAVTVMVRFLVFSKSVTLSVEHSYDLEDGPINALLRSRFTDVMDQNQWSVYCDAFA
jgi:hypothetical protein